MSIRLVIEVEQDSADFDQLNHVGLDFLSEVRDFEPEAGVRVVAITVTDEFGGLVSRHEPDRSIFIQPDGQAMVQQTSRSKS